MVAGEGMVAGRRRRARGVRSDGVGCADGRACGRGEQGDAGQRFLEESLGALDLEAHQGDEAIVMHAMEDIVGREVEAAQILERQINAAARSVLADVAQDVRELQRDAERDGV